MQQYQIITGMIDVSVEINTRMTHNFLMVLNAFIDHQVAVKHSLVTAEAQHFPSENRIKSLR